ncbi:unnamed protein product [Pleuronectes platessa]|uniref:Uncharacterized protein n=1 Tax=Pleuronectes platessa TaxID=8262 RepID=A0A9N7TGV4_PLEPL|nr:unnamed protein product [Pleuronectes platessa]
MFPLDMGCQDLKQYQQDLDSPGPEILCSDAFTVSTIPPQDPVEGCSERRRDRLPDASPQHHPTHGLEVHCNTEPSCWGGRVRERARYSKEEGRGNKRRTAREHTEGKVDHSAEEGQLE